MEGECPRMDLVGYARGDRFNGSKEPMMTYTAVLCDVLSCTLYSLGSWEIKVEGRLTNVMVVTCS